MSQPHHIVIVGLGPGSPGLLTFEARSLLATGPVYLRTRIHPTLDELPEAADWPSFDALYERAEDFEGLYNEIVATLLDAARRQSIVYAVPGHPLFGEATVRLLLERASASGVEIRVVPGISFFDAAVAALGVDPVETNLQLVDALDLAAFTEREPFAGGSLPVSPLYPALVAQLYSRPIASAAKLALLRIYPPDTLVTLVTAAGAGDAILETVPLHELDHRAPNHLTSLYLPSVDPLDCTRVSRGVEQIVARLRAPGGCPWDREQTHRSLATHMIEEAYEAVDAIEHGSPDDLAEELGDVLLQIYLHAQIAEEEGTFTLEDVFEALASKLVRRHPHVFGSRQLETAGEVVQAWDQIKQGERQARDAAAAEEEPLGHVPTSLPALSRAQTLVKRARRRSEMAGIESEATGATDEAERGVAAELAQVVGHAIDAGIDAEQALRHWTTRLDRAARQRLSRE